MRCSFKNKKTFVKKSMPTLIRGVRSPFIIAIACISWYPPTFVYFFSGFFILSDCIWKFNFLTFPACFSIPIIFSNLNFNCSNLWSLRNLKEQVKKAFCYQKLFWPFTLWINFSSDLKNFANSPPPASNFKSFSRSLEQFFLTVGQNNFGNKIPFSYTK